MEQLLDRVMSGVQEGTALFLGILCLLVFCLNAALMVFLIVRKGGHGLAKCPRCGRVIACPHCEEDRESTDS